MWKICLLLGILVIAISAAPQAPAAEEKAEPVKFNLCSLMLLWIDLKRKLKKAKNECQIFFSSLFLSMNINTK